jgi:hypothetical protein
MKSSGVKRFVDRFLANQTIQERDKSQGKFRTTILQIPDLVVEK